MKNQNPWRKTTQKLMPSKLPDVPVGRYNLYPAFPIGEHKIFTGYQILAEWIATHEQIILDGYVGVYWDDLRSRLDDELKALGVDAHWVNVEQALQPTQKVEALVEPFLGGDDPIFGTRFTGKLVDFFDAEKLRALCPKPARDTSIIYGCGAALAEWSGPLIYVDLPKNELQFRSRAGTVTNLGCQTVIPPKPMYKRFYFVDWVALNHHKAQLLPDIDIIVDIQRPKEPAIMSGEDLRIGLSEMSQN
jgi:hypothetical protein